MIKIKGGPKDINQLAKLIADITTGNTDNLQVITKSKKKVARPVKSKK